MDEVAEKADFEVEKARVGGARVEKEVKKQRYLKPIKTAGLFDLENLCKYTYIFHIFQICQFHKYMHGAYTGAQVTTFKLVQKTMQNHHKNEHKKHRNRVFWSPPGT